jgi:hypothetical protein
MSRARVAVFCGSGPFFARIRPKARNILKKVLAPKAFLKIRNDQSFVNVN